jgi:RNA polymerase sigma-70 factor (ECF subfamily)
VRAWLLKIASNAFFDVHRRRRTASMRVLETEPVDSAGPPGEAVEASELNELLGDAIAALPDKPRVVFLLRAREGLSFREIAEIIETSEETARWHMLQARKALLARLNGKL